MVATVVMVTVSRTYGALSLEDLTNEDVMTSTRTNSEVDVSSGGGGDFQLQLVTADVTGDVGEAGEGGDPVVDDSNAGDDVEDNGGDDNELMVLDPSHPLMQRVQAALKAQLTRQNEKLEIELKEKMETLKTLRSDREETGIELYGIQQQLARQQMLVEQEQDKQAAMSLLGKQKYEALAQVRELYQNMQKQVEEERKQTIQLRHDVENVTARLHYMSEAKDAVKDDIALTKRATEKTAVDVNRAQEEKQKQDLFLDRLTSRIHDLEEQIGLYEMQYKAQAQETKAVKEALAEASMELETVYLEKKKLLQQWNNSLIGMRRRDEAYSAMITAVNMQRQQLCSLETEVENYKKNITKEQERNEGLTMMVNKVEADIAHVKRLIEASEAKLELLKTEYTTYTRTLQETEQSLAKATTDCTLKRNELGVIRTQTEREAEEKRKLEYSIMEKMMQRLTMDKATQYTRKAVEKVRKRTEELDINVADVENEISQTQLQKLQVTSRLKRLQQSLDEMNIATHQQNEIISKSEAIITRNNALIERKQTQIDQMNKKIDQKFSSMDGGEDLGPLEQKIEGLRKQISDSIDQCSQMQLFWLRQQNELVKKTRFSDDQAQTVNSLKKQLLILEQKKMRTDTLLEQEEKERSQVEHSISSLQKDMVRLSALITEKRGQQERLEQGNILVENDFIHALKEAELESIQLQSKVDQLREEKERLLNSVVESEHQIMLWEKKIQIAREMKEAVDSDVGQSEIRAMKAEIHRMQVRHDQLMRQQEKMIQDMEKAVYRREAIILRGEAQTKSGKKEQTQGHLKKKISDKQQQIKQTVKETTMCEGCAQGLQSSQQSVSVELGEKQSLCQQLRSTMDTMTAQVAQAEETKKQAMVVLLSSQAKVKYLSAAKEGKYKMVSKSQEARETEWQRQQEKLHSIQAIMERLEEDYPESESQLRPLSISIRSRLAQAANTKPHKVVEVV